MTVAILRTMMQVLLRLSRKPFDRKPVSPHRVVWRHGGTGRTATLPGTVVSRAHNAVDLNACVEAPGLKNAGEDHKREHFNVVGHQQTLAFGVRLVC